MTKLSNLRPRLSTMPTRFGDALRDEAERSRMRYRTQPWQRWYNTARWKRIRSEVLSRDMFTCQRCKRIEPNTAKLVCDHVKPHHGNEQAFWAGPFQCLCKACHDSVKQSEEKRNPMPRGQWY